jgi:hypothetical protein
MSTQTLHTLAANVESDVDTGFLRGCRPLDTQLICYSALLCYTLLCNP